MFVEERLKKILSILETYRIDHSVEVENIVYAKGDFKTCEEANRLGKFEHHKNKGLWGGDDERYWFKTAITIPSTYEDKVVCIHLTTGQEGEWDALNPQFLLFVNRHLTQGLDVNHREVVLTKNAYEGEVYELDFHAYAGMQNQPVAFQLKLGILDIDTEQLIFDLKVLYEALLVLEKNTLSYISLKEHLRNALNLLDLKDQEKTLDYYKSIGLVSVYLKENVYGHELLADALKKSNLLPVVSCVGHSHIDVAWLWTLKQTREKAVRSFSTVLHLMEDYPEYIFMASQPILLDFIKKDYPDLFDRIKEKNKLGQFEIEGGMWLEADCNLSSGESLIRHILYGKAYMKEHFDVTSKILWLPDVFGYSAALPQILKLFHIDTFVTTKISWNEYNKMPYDTFNWQGIDGSEVLSYFMTMMDYNNYKKGSFKTIYEGVINPAQLQGAWARYQQKDLNQDVLISYGYGDGGGGPTKEMLEVARRMANYIPGLPQLAYTSVRDYFEKLRKRAPELPKWVGELYLEYHRGTLTTMGQSKKYNRKSEVMYQQLEYLSVLSKKLNLIDVHDPLIRTGWDVILLNQFHDIIPGTSIKAVYDESFSQYENILTCGKVLQNQLLERLQMSLLSDTFGNKTHLVLWNTTQFTEDQIITFESSKSYDVFYGNQKLESQHTGNFITFIDALPSKGYKVYQLIENEFTRVIPEKIMTFESDYYTIQFDASGHIVSLIDKALTREIVLKDKKLNQMTLYEDRPHNWDAWDINAYYEEKPYAIEVHSEFEVIASGPVFYEIKTKRKFLKSSIDQTIKIYKRHRRIDFETTVDWHEKHLLLKVAFPVDIINDHATYDIQFGMLKRPNHHNTSWDAAKFEVCGHKWADLSERGYGVSLLNDAKYGYDIKGQVIRLSLLKSSTYPNETADQGLHTFKYALLPHVGDLVDTSIHEGILFNTDVLYQEVDVELDPNKASGLSFFSVNKNNVIIETIKPWENGEGTLIRLYESHQKNTSVELSFHLNYKEAYEVDLDENIIEEINMGQHVIQFDIKPFEIKTILLK